MSPIQPILSFSCFRGFFREFRVMTMAIKKNPVHETEVQPKIHTKKEEYESGKLSAHPARSQVYRLGRKLSVCLDKGEPVHKPSVCSPTRVYDPRLSAHPAYAQTFGLVASLSTCSAKVGRFQRPTRLS